MLLIVGGSGFIGMHAAREFLDSGEQVAATRYRTQRAPELLEELHGGRDRVTFVQLDMTDSAAVQATFERLGVTSVLNLLAPPPGAWTASEDYRANMFGLLHLLEAGERAGVRRITMASSVTVYAGLPRGPFRETQRFALETRSPTEAFKKAEEILGLHYAARTGLDLRFARLSIIYGPLYHSLRNFPSRVAHAAAKARPLDLASAGHAADAIDACYVKDVVHGLRLLHNTPKLSHTIYNLGSGLATTNEAVVQAARQVVPSFRLDLPAGSSKGAPVNPAADIKRAQHDFGYAPRFDIAQGLVAYIDWLQRHPE